MIRRVSLKELVPMNDYGIFATTKYEVRVDSRYVAEVFEKEHKDVLKAIRNIIENSGFSKEFNRRNFAPTKYIDEHNRTQACYAMTRDGFTALVMGFTGRKVDQFKELYITRFNAMEEQIRYLQSLREQHPQLTAAIKSIHDEPKFYHYSNEMDMLNKIALGMTGKQFRELHNIPEEEPIRPYLSSTEAELLDLLQNFDIGFVIAVPDFTQRRQMLEYQAMKWRQERLYAEVAQLEERAHNADTGSMPVFGE